MSKVIINFSKLEKVVQQALKETALITHRNILQVMSEPGAFPSTPNDLVDKGILRSSQQQPLIQGGTVTFYNTAAYAIYVYLGYTRRNGTTVEGRPWMQLGIERTNFQQTFELLLKSKL